MYAKRQIRPFVFFSLFCFLTLLLETSLSCYSLFGQGRLEAANCCPRPRCGNSCGNNCPPSNCCPPVCCPSPVPPTPITPNFFSSFFTSENFVPLEAGDPLPLGNGGSHDIVLGSAISRIDSNTLMLQPGYYEVLFVAIVAQTSESLNVQITLNGTFVGPYPEVVTDPNLADEDAQGGNVPIITILRVSTPSAFQIIAGDFSGGDQGGVLNEDTPVMITIKLLGTLDNPNQCASPGYTGYSIPCGPASCF